MKIPYSTLENVENSLFMLKISNFSIQHRVDFYYQFDTSIFYVS
jgi:hypothetical protein